MKLKKQWKFPSKKQDGFTITELMLVLGVGAIITAGAFIGYKTLSGNNATQQNVTATVNLVAAVKNKWQGIGSYTGVNNTAIVNAGLISKPLTGSGSSITNVWEQALVFVGAAGNYAAQISVPPTQCIDIVGSMDGIAYRVDVDTAGIAPATAEDAAKTVKPASTGIIDGTKVNTQCGGATTVITAFVR